MVLTGFPHSQGVRLILKFGMPDARNSHLPNVGLGSQPEVSDGRENVGFWGTSRPQDRAAEGPFIAKRRERQDKLAKDRR